ncbi:uncharacterized protein LOC144572351 isoform X2 [Carex rostrata]
MVQINICFYLLKAMGVLADSLSIALEMSEESSSGNSIIQSKAIPNRKRKETKAVPDPSIVEEDILVHSDHSMSSHSARTTLVRNLDESPFRARHYYGRQNIVPTPVGGLELVEEMLVPIKECYFGRRDGSRKVPFSLHFIVNLRVLLNNTGEMYNLLNFLQPTSFSSLWPFEEKFKTIIYITFF